MFSSFNARAVGLASLGAETTIDVAAAAGFAGVDLMVRDILHSGSDPRALRSRMNDQGLRGGAFPFPIDWKGDEAAFVRDLKALPPILEMAGTLGLSRTGTWVMSERPHRSISRDQVIDLHLERIGKVARLMNDFGIKIGLEVIGVESFGTHGSEPFIRRLGDLDRELGPIWGESPNLGILLDAFHLFAANESIEAGLAWGVGRIIWVHVADPPPGDLAERSKIVDANRGLPGENGAVDVSSFLARLSREGYDGPVTVEPLANCQSLRRLDPSALASRVKKSLDRVWPGS